MAVGDTHGDQTHDSSAAGWTVPGYADGEQLGAGAGGRVVVATHLATGRRVAVKYLSEELRSEPGFRNAFRSEAELLGSLGSPHVTAFYEYVEGPRGAAIVMELIPGVPLRALLRQEGPAGPEAALVVLKGSLLGLADAHRAGVVHRDYKPENVLVRRDGTSALVDFGIARRDGDPGTDGGGAGPGSSISGTPPYMAPEQWRGAPADAATDVYAATVTFYECLTGERPYGGASLAELAVQHTTAPIPLEQAPQAVRGLLARGMAKDPAERPRDALDLVAELDRVAGAAYGPHWEERGQRRLAALAALVPLLFRPDETDPAGVTDLAVTRLPEPPEPPVATTRLPGRPGRDRGAWLATIGAALLAGLVLLLTQVPSGWAGGQGQEALATTGPAAVAGDEGSAPDGDADGGAGEGTSTGEGEEVHPDEEADEAEGESAAAEGEGTSEGGSDGTGGATGGGDGSSAAGSGSGGATGEPGGPGGTGGGGDGGDSGGGGDSGDPADPGAGGAEVTGISAGETSIGYEQECACWVAYARPTITTDGPGPVTVTVQWFELSSPGDPGIARGPAEPLVLEGARSYSPQLRHEKIRAYECDTWYRVEITAPSGQASPGSAVVYGECLG